MTTAAPKLGRQDLAKRVAQRLPQPDPNDMRYTYHGGLTRAKSDWFPRWRATTIDTVFTPVHWDRHQSAWRHVLNFHMFSSQTLRRLLVPDLAIVGSISLLVVSVNLAIVGGPFSPGALAHAIEQPGFDLVLHPDMFTLPQAPFALSGFALGLLISQRLQACHSRWVEGRLIWGDLLNTSRDVASRLLAMGQAGGPWTTEDDADRAHLLRCIRSFPLCLQYRLTVDGFNEHVEVRGRTAAQVEAEKNEALADELALVWGQGDDKGGRDPFVARLVAADVPSKPLFVLHEMSTAIARLRARGAVDAMQAMLLENRLADYARILGASERLLRTPIYTPYTHHTTRFLLIWCSTLPFAMYPVVGPVGTAPVSLVISYMMLGIEDIASRIEQPFEVLPLWRYAATVDESVSQLESHHAAQTPGRAA